jgi:hypothetical protein
MGACYRYFGANFRTMGSEFVVCGKRDRCSREIGGTATDNTTTRTIAGI